MSICLKYSGLEIDRNDSITYSKYETNNVLTRYHTRKVRVLRDKNEFKALYRAQWTVQSEY